MQTETRKVLQLAALAFLAGVATIGCSVALIAQLTLPAAGLLLLALMAATHCLRIAESFTSGPRAGAAGPPAGSTEAIRGGTLHHGPPSSPRPSGSLAHSRARAVIRRAGVADHHGYVLTREALQGIAQEYNAMVRASEGSDGSTRFAVEGDELVWYGPAEHLGAVMGYYMPKGDVRQGPAVGMSWRPK
jgi:hypothetical protein